MLDFETPLAGFLKKGRLDAPGVDPIRVKEEQVGFFLQVSKSRLAPVNWLEAISDVLGGKPAISYRDAGHFSDGLFYRIGPDRILIAANASAGTEIFQHVGKIAGLNLLDLSSARASIALSGISVWEVLSRLMAIDLHPSAFVAGHFVQTGVHSIPVLLHRLDDRGGAPNWRLYMPRTWACSLWDLLSKAAEPFRVNLE